MPEDIYYKKTLTYNFWKQSLQFRTSQELFSSHDIDLGTQFLLRTIVEAQYAGPKSILDMGCGYGPLGLTLRKLNPDSSVHMVDRDALAVAYSSQNAAITGISGVEVYGSLGYDDIKKSDFDLIVSNIPGKAGEPVITCWLQEAGYYLAPQGLAAIVAVKALEETVGGILEKTPGIEVVLKRARSSHSVFHFRFSGPSGTTGRPPGALERGIYRRNSQTFNFQKREYRMQTAFGLPEFDSLDYRSEMLMQALRERPAQGVKTTAVFNPGQGHFAVMLWQRMHPQSIALIDRDLLALRYTQLNLGLNQCPSENIRLFHQVGMAGESEEKFDLIAGVLREEEGVEAVELTLRQAAARLSGDGVILVSAGSTAITRLTDGLKRQALLRIQAREKWRGYSLLVLSSSVSS
jgi:16S rRNA (guanine1207-N2)-methyltransferase